MTRTLINHKSTEQDVQEKENVSPVMEEVIEENKTPSVIQSIIKEEDIVEEEIKVEESLEKNDQEKFEIDSLNEPAIEEKKTSIKQVNNKVRKNSIIDNIKKQITKINTKLANEKKKSILKNIVTSGLIIGIVGVVIFLGIIIIGIISGQIYMFDGYLFTRIITTISIVCMFIGIISIIGYFILSILISPPLFKKRKIKRTLAIIMAVICVGFSIWGISNCNKSGGLGLINQNDLYQIYEDCGCSGQVWAKFEEGQLLIDTNPFDYDGDAFSSKVYFDSAVSAIEKINEKLKIPYHVTSDMIHTADIDGEQEYTSFKVKVSWRYHPDNGLEVRYQ